MARQKKNSKGYYRKTFTYNGKRYEVSGKTQDELIQKLADKRKMLEASAEARSNPTLEAYFDYFIDTKRNSVKPNTIRAYMSRFNIIKVAKISDVSITDLKIKDITRKDIETFRQKMTSEGKSNELINVCVKLLKAVFESAVIDDTIEKNPCRGFKPLKRSNESWKNTKHRALSPDECERFLKALEEKNSPYQNAIKLMLLTGMRFGEIGALYLTDIDENFIHVRRTITWTETNFSTVGEDTKTEAGQRDIPLTADIKKVLHDQKELNFLLFGSKWSGTIFKTISGTILKNTIINREIKTICEKINIQPFSCHALRVTFATRFIEQRPQDFKILSEILGHEKINMTLELYTRVMKESKITAMNELKIING